MKTGRQPGLQAGLGVRQVHVSHPDLGESKLAGPGLNLRPQRQCRAFVPRQSDALPGCFVLIALHPPILETRWARWGCEADCQAFAQSLAAKPGIGGAFITLQGPLGAGKTTLVRHLLRALGVQGRIKSPTYTVMEPYTLATGGAAAHFDFYRFNNPREWADAGFREVFASPGLKLAEWPDKAAGALPHADLALHISPVMADSGDGICTCTCTCTDADADADAHAHAHADTDTDTDTGPAGTALDDSRQVLLHAYSALGLALLR